MTPERVLDVVVREMTAIGRGWRYDWSDFDGRSLRSQLNDIEKWAIYALASPEQDLDYLDGTEFEKGKVN